MTIRPGLLACALSLLLSTFAGAGAATNELPPELSPWADWALHGQESKLCTPMLGAADTTSCLWPGVLALELGASDGSFAQRWRVEAAGYAPLPGAERQWPQDVRVDGAPAAVVDRGGVPSLFLKTGEHAVEGRFQWDAPPQALPIPAATGIVRLRLDGRPVPLPVRDAEGRLFLSTGGGGESEKEALEIAVQRRVTDDIPLLVHTRIQLSVAGQAREVLFASALLPQSIPFALESALPAQLEPNGRLRVQVRPGTWKIAVISRRQGPVTELTLPAQEGLWPAEEIWTFEARPALRRVEIEGVLAVDPQQTRLPEDWKALPAYRMQPGDSMRLTERARGDSAPAADRLQMERNLWLDFDGGGLTLEDHLTGTLTRAFRLEIDPPIQLQRAVVSGRDQVITRRDQTANAGFEIRQGAVDVRAEGRIEHPGGLFSRLPAVGWTDGMQQLSATLHLPPAWRLFTAFGVDSAPEAWTSRWRLLDFFVVLIAALAARALWGNRWGLLALVTLVLCYHEPRAPSWIWLVAFAFEALRRLLPAGTRAGSVAKAVWGIAIAALLLWTVPFLVLQVRQALYPALEPAQGFSLVTTQGELSSLGSLAQATLPAAPPPAASPERERPESDRKADYGQRANQKLRSLLYDQVDPRAVVATGPGLPTWRWHQASLRWSGPVERDQHVRLVLLSPAATLLLAVLRVALLVLLLLRVLGVPRTLMPAGSRKLRQAGVTALLLLAWLAPVDQVRAEIPSPEMLEQLRARLLERPDCSPHCATASRLLLEFTPATLRGRLEIGAVAATAIPLPGGLEHWTPAEVLVDGHPAALLRGAEGALWVAMAAGRHTLEFQGPLPERELVALPLPLRPHRVEARGSGWTLDGIHQDGVPDSALQLSRQRALPSASAALAAAELPPFLLVERTLSLGLTWTIETRVARLSPPGSPVVAEIPLLAGESVTTEGMRIENGQAQVSLGPQALSTTWHSVLEPRPLVELSAPSGLAWTEAWLLIASPVWHVEAKGIPPIHSESAPGDESSGADAAVRIPVWRPWPGEQLQLEITRPQGIPGASMTVDSTRLRVLPGLRTSDADLEFVRRSSRGGQQIVTLPAGAELLSVTIDGTEHAIRLDGNKVALPVTPGAQTVKLSWREARGARLFWRTPRADLGTPSVNAEITAELGTNRWILAVGGPRLGPAVLFWSLLTILALIAFGLGKLQLTPLRALAWLLLGIGLSQVALPAAALVGGWLFALGLRRERGPRIERAELFNLMQIGLALWTLLALAVVVWSVHQGLLGEPEMQIAGNGSSASSLRWFADRSSSTLPSGWVLSVPLLVYRVAMLAWALWLALALLRWLRWGWESFTLGGGWRRQRTLPPPIPTAAS